MISDCIAVMNLGRVMHYGLPLDVNETPEKRFVVEFMGHANLSNGRVLSDKNGYCMIACGLLVLSARRKVRQEPGEPITVAIRYEKVAVSAVLIANVFEGQITDVVYIGPTYRPEIRRVPGGEILFSDIGGAIALAPFSPGQRVYVSWSCDAAVLVSD